MKLYAIRNVKNDSYITDDGNLINDLVKVTDANSITPVRYIFSKPSSNMKIYFNKDEFIEIVYYILSLNKFLVSDYVVKIKNPTLYDGSSTIETLSNWIKKYAIESTGDNIVRWAINN